MDFLILTEKLKKELDEFLKSRNEKNTDFGREGNELCWIEEDNEVYYLNFDIDHENYYEVRLENFPSFSKVHDIIERLYEKNWFTSKHVFHMFRALKKLLDNLD